MLPTRRRTPNGCLAVPRPSLDLPRSRFPSVQRSPADLLGQGTLSLTNFAAGLRSSDVNFDLNDPLFLQTLLQGVASDTGVTLDPSVLANAAQVVSNVNTYIDSIPGSGSAFVSQLVQAQTATEGTVTQMLTQVGAGTLDVNTVLAQTTGTAFTTLVASAPVGTLTQSMSVDNFLTSYNDNYNSPNPDGDTAFIQGLYRTILGRDVGMITPDLTETQFWLAQMQGGLTRAQVTEDIYNSLEHRTEEVSYFYFTLLGRDVGQTPDAQAQYWIDVLMNGAGEEAVVAGIMGSSEYQALHPSNADFENQLYLNLLGRGLSQSESTSLTNQLNNGTTRTELALANSQEAAQVVVQGDYQSYFHRNPDADAMVWADLLSTGQMTLDQVAVSLLSDSTVQEFYKDGLATVQ